MSEPTLCVVFNNVDESSGIGRLCVWAVRSALEADWRVTVLARDLAPDLRAEVEWLPLHVPARAHAVQWFSAEPIARKALRSRVFDVVHVQQPQLVRMADLLHLHYLVGAARRRYAGAGPAGCRSRLSQLQARATEVGEDWYLRRLPAELVLAPVSQFLADEFAERFGRHDRTTVLDSPSEGARVPSAASRAQARRHFALRPDDFVVGFLGGADPRKGGPELLNALRPGAGVHLLYGGAGAPAHSAFGARRLATPVGYVEDRERFFAACDAFAAVSSFDPGPLTALEAAARGVPVIGTEGCGIVRDMVRAGSAVRWQPGQALDHAMAEVRRCRTDLVATGLSFARARSRTDQAQRLLELYDDIRRRAGASHSFGA